MVVSIVSQFLKVNENSTITMFTLFIVTKPSLYYSCQHSLEPLVTPVRTTQAYKTNIHSQRISMK